MNQDVLHCDRTLCANAAQCQQCINELVKLIAGWICSKVSTFATVAKSAQAGEWLTRNAVWSQSAAATVKMRTHRSSEDQGALHLTRGNKLCSAHAAIARTRFQAALARL
jgi:hypothetical protein